MEEAMMYEQYDNSELALLESSTTDEIEVPWFLDHWTLEDFEDLFPGPGA